MSTDNKLMDMLTGYAASHQHPFNIFIHMIGIPTIMLGILIPLSWVGIDIDPNIGQGSLEFTLAQVLVFGFFAFYLTLDKLFAVVFLVFGFGISLIAGWIGNMPFSTSATAAAGCFFGGYLAQFIGHAVEKSMPVLVKHPIQANLAAPFFVVVELFKILGLRDELFNEVQREVAVRRGAAADRQ
jgi:uncharacterized membrane protein YGL010W